MIKADHMEEEKQTRPSASKNLSKNEPEPYPSVNKTNGDCLPSPSEKNYDNHVSERLETFESNFSHISEREQESKKLERYIQKSFERTNKAPDTSAKFYRIGKILGKGAFGKVNLAVHRLSTGLVAIKSINKTLITEDGQRQKVLQEVSILKRLRHRNIVNLYDTFDTNKHIIFVLELCSGGDLLNYVRKRRKLTEETAKFIFMQILEGLWHCHSNYILHRDIKLDNILLDANGVVKIGDFGVAKIVTPDSVMHE